MIVFRRFCRRKTQPDFRRVPRLHRGGPMEAGLRNPKGLLAWNVANRHVPRTVPGSFEPGRVQKEAGDTADNARLQVWWKPRRRLFNVPGVTARDLMNPPFGRRLPRSSAGLVTDLCRALRQSNPSREACFSVRGSMTRMSSTFARCKAERNGQRK